MQFTIEELHEIETEMLKEVVAICERYKIDYYLAYGSLLGAVRHKGPIPWDSDVDIKVPINQLDNFISKLRSDLPDKYYLDHYDVNKNYLSFLPRVGVKGFTTKTLHLDIYILVGAPSSRIKQYIFKTKAVFYRTLFLFKNFNREYIGKFNFKRRFFAPIIKFFLLPISNKTIIRNFEKLCHKYPIEKAEYIVNSQFGYHMKEFIPASMYGKGAQVEYLDLEVNAPEKYKAYLEAFYDDYMQPPPERKRASEPVIEIDEM